MTRGPSKGVVRPRRFPARCGGRSRADRSGAVRAAPVPPGRLAGWCGQRPAAGTGALPARWPAAEPLGTAAATSR
jgi:hypothetical protein